MTKDLHSLAERFMQDQLAIMKKYGHEPNIDNQRYERAVRETQRTFKGLSVKKVRPLKSAAR